MLSPAFLRLFLRFSDPIGLHRTALCAEQRLTVSYHVQDAIQADLIARGYATEGDEVMAEFVFVMLCNHKTPAQITAELQDLIGPDFDATFTSWLFATFAQHYPKAKSALLYGPPPADAPSAQNPPAIKSESDGSAQPRNAFTSSTGRPSPFGVFGNAMAGATAGVKRPSDASFGSSPAQRARTENAPSNAPRGPKNPLPTDGSRAGGPPPRSRSPGGSSLMDRLGPQQANNPMMPMMGAPPFFPGFPPPEMVRQHCSPLVDSCR